LIGVVGAEGELRRLAAVHKPQLLRIVGAQAHALAHHAPVLLYRLHCLCPTNTEVGIAIVHQAHNVVIQADITIWVHLILVPINTRRYILPVNYNVLVEI
jgi:hypothetical protein